MAYKIVPECPQCGAPVEMDELDRVLSCPYCEVRSYLYTRDYFRLVMPHNASDKDLIYAPYLRFKGTVYYCQGTEVKYRLLDITNVGTELQDLPYSLGFNTQVFKLKFITPETEGSFLQFDLARDQILERAGKISTSYSSLPLYHSAFIGETLSIVYLPMYIKDHRLFDAVVNRPIINLNNHINFSELTTRNPRWKLGLLPVICPGCGWDLQGAGDSAVLTCSNCGSAWSALAGKFTKVDVRSLPGKGDNLKYLPFWKISVTAENGETLIGSFADYIRQTGCLPEKDILPAWENKQMDFWIPAFKINPKIYLDLANRLTFSLQGKDLQQKIPRNNIYPVTLPASEASESIKIIYAHAVNNRYKKNVYPQLPDITFEPVSTALVYLPFTETAMEMIQQQSSVSFFKAALSIGRIM